MSKETNDLPKWLVDVCKEIEADINAHEFHGFMVIEITSTCDSTQCTSDIEDMLNTIEKRFNDIHAELT